MNASKLQFSVIDLQASHDDHGAAIQAVIAEVDALIGERVVIAQILADFYRAELSVSSVQPVLDLAMKLNPSLAPKLTLVSARNSREVADPEPAANGVTPCPTQSMKAGA